MNTNRLNDLGHAQRDRMAYIELRLWFVGEIRRQDLASRFDDVPGLHINSSLRFNLHEVMNWARCWSAEFEQQGIEHPVAEISG